MSPKCSSCLKRLRDEGLALLYISHRMHEIAELADECTVFRNGSNVASYVAGTKSDDEVVEMMIGRELSHVFPAKPPPRETAAAPLIEVKHLNWADRLRDISFHAHAGEVVGLGGLDGQGQRELLLALFGVLRGVSGEIRVAGAPVAPSSPNAAKSKGVGMALIPEDRKTEGLMLPMSLRDNLSFASLERISRGGVIDHAREMKLVGDMIDLLAIRASGTDIPAGRAVGRQPAEGRHRQMADGRAAHHPAQRSDARHRRRHQAGDLSAPAPPRRFRGGDHLLHHRL